MVVALPPNAMHLHGGRGCTRDLAGDYSTANRASALRVVRPFGLFSLVCESLPDAAKDVLPRR